MSEDSNTTELLDDSSSDVFTWAFEEKSSCSVKPSCYHPAFKEEVEFSGENGYDSGSDSSSIICLDEFQRDNEEAISSPKKIKLENIANSALLVNVDATLSHQALPIHKQTPSYALDNRPDVESENVSSLSAFSNTIEDSLNTEVSIDSIPNFCSTVKFTSVRRLTRDELEMIIMKQMVDAITANKNISLLEEKLEATEKMLQLSTKKIAKLAQEVAASDMILRRFLTQVQSGQAKIYHPPKKTVRSVGVQIKQAGSTKRVMKMMESKLTVPSGTNTAICISKEESSSAEAATKAISIATDCSQANSKKAENYFSDLRTAPSLKGNIEIPPPKKGNSQEGEVNTIPHDLPTLPEPSSGSLVPLDPSWKPVPPKLALQISKVALNLYFSWYATPSACADIKCYQIWGYSKSSCPSGKWELLADLPPDRLPMSSHIDGSKWAQKLKTSERGFFIIRAVDIHERDGPWSDPAAILFP